MYLNLDIIINYCDHHIHNHNDNDIYIYIYIIYDNDKVL